MEKTTIVKAKISDWPDLLVIFDKSLRSSIDLPDDDWKKLYERVITYNYPSLDTYIYKQGDKSVGYISYCTKEKIIKQLYVLPQYHNQGIGQKLIKYIIDTYSGPMSIGVRTDNDVALHIYTKFGFEKISEEKYDASGIYMPHYILRKNA